MTVLGMFSCTRRFPFPCHAIFLLFNWSSEHTFFVSPMLLVQFSFSIFFSIFSVFFNVSFSIFNENFKLVSTTHLYNTRSARNGLWFVSSYKSVRFERKLIIHSTTLTWDYLQDKLTEHNFPSLTPRSLKILLVKFFFSVLV